MLMGLMFVGGVMNVLLMSGLAALMFTEQVLPWARLATRGTGAALVVCGSVALAAAVA